MTNATILHMRVEWFAEHYRGPKFHAILCDPPYEYGFMGKSWDRTGIAYRPDTWAGLAKHLHPGGFGMAFASARGWHRLAVAIEDAGLIIHPSIFGWAYGSGFPKATRIDTQVDRDAGAEREVIGERRQRANSLSSIVPMNASVGDTEVITAPATELARAWEGHRYGLQALKPALEPIIVFQKPYQGRPVDNITATGAGALNIDGARIPLVGDENLDAKQRQRSESMFASYTRSIVGKEIDTYKPSGRWPSNLLLLDDGAAAALDAQSGERGGGYGVRCKGGNKYAGGKGFANTLAETGQVVGYGDTGGASRFFYRVRAALDAADPVCYTAKASRAEREAGLEGMESKDGGAYASGKGLPGRTLKDGEWVQTGTWDEPNRKSRRNHHPTVKPLDLARYLATLLLPPDEYAPRRILVPFAGSGSECIGAFMAGWDEIVGVEFIREYVDIARARLAYWMSQQGVQLDFMEELTA